MANYTTMVRTICEVNAGYDESQGYESIKDVIENSRTKIFNFDYPIFDDKYRSVLETKILKHYYTREIGLETVGLWKLKLDTKLNEIMPYYNQLYKSELITFNPMYDTELERTHTVTANNNRNDEENKTNNATQSGTVNVTGTQVDVGKDVNVGSVDTDSSQSNKGNSNVIDINNTNHENTDKTKGNNTSTTVGKTTVDNSKTDKYADTPQGEISNLASSKYLTNARMIDDENTTDTNNKVTDIIDSSITSTGTVGVKGEVNSNDNRTITGNVNTDTTDTRNTNFNSNTSNDTISQNTTAGSNKSNLTSTINTFEEYVEMVKGKQSGKNFSEMLEDFRNTFLNIDMQVIEELSDLFMLIW